MSEWGVSHHAANLVIDLTPSKLDNTLPVVIDVETDEKDNFVGMGWTQDGTTVSYSNCWTSITQMLAYYTGPGLIGHNLKFDAKLLVKWGLTIDPKYLKDDTILMSYVVNTTKDSHSLKDLGKEFGYEWPTYSEMVGKGKKKQTLDKQDIETVANYCGMDVLVTYKLWEKFTKQMDLNQRRVYQLIEMPLMRILFEMELQGVLIDVNKLTTTHAEFTSRLLRLGNRLQQLANAEINPNSNNQVADILEARGLTLPRTPKGNRRVDKFILEQHQDDDFVKLLMEYNKIEKLVSTYTGGLLKRETLPKVFTTYNQVVVSKTDEKGISTGRLSSTNPNLQQIPTRTEEGQLLRELFIPRPGFVLIDADYSQIEYRLLAHFTKEPVLLEAFHKGQDIHEATGNVLGCSRDVGKTLNFASIYGAQAAKIARTAKVSEEEADNFLKKYWSKLPSVTAWINRVKHEASKRKGVFTLMKRWIPLSGIDSRNKFERWHWERCAVNFMIQGSAAEIMKMAMIELKKKGFLPLLTVHDELLFEAEDKFGDLHADELDIKRIMESVVTLDVPLIADVGIGSTWRKAKGD